jgi:hypothetical protein
MSYKKRMIELYITEEDRDTIIMLMKHPLATNGVNPDRGFGLYHSFSILQKKLRTSKSKRYTVC